MSCPRPLDGDSSTIHSFLLELRENVSRHVSSQDPFRVLNNESLPCMCFDQDNFARTHFNVSIQCQPFPLVHPIWVQLFYIVLFTTTILVALIGNFTVMWIVLRHRTMRTITNYFLLNLAIADASISIFNTGFSWTYNFYYQWIFGLFYCRVNNLMGITPICASVFTMIVMSIDRYRAIVYPLRRRVSRRATGIVIGSVWILAILCGLPSFFMAKVETTYFFDGETSFEHTVCMSDNYAEGGEKWAQMYTTGLVIVQYFLPLLILSVAYFRVGTVLRKDKCVGDSRHAKSMAAKKKAAFMLALVVFIFMVVWLPYNTYFVISDYLPSPETPETAMTQMYIYINIYWLGMSSTVFNPIIYYFMNRRFRVGFRYAFRWLPWVRASRSEYMAVLSSNNRPTLLPPHTAATEF